MNLILFGKTALAYWASAPALPRDQLLSDNSLFSSGSPGKRAADYLAQRIPHVSQPYHLSVSAQRRRLDARLELHRSSAKHNGEPVFNIGHGIWAPSPEMSLMQAAKELSIGEIVKCGNMLCGSYVIADHLRHGLGERVPLTSVQAMAKLAKRCCNRRGRALLDRAIPYIVDGSASPPEGFLALVFKLPTRLGGYGLGDFELNKTIRLSTTAQKLAGRRVVMPDLYWGLPRIALEYDSNAEHLDERRFSLDASKRMAIQAKRIRLITITAGQLRDREAMGRVAHEIARLSGKRWRSKSASFEDRNRELWDMGWTFKELVGEP